MASKTLGLACASISAELTTVVGVGASKPALCKRVEETVTCSTPSCASAAPALSATMAAPPIRRTRINVKPKIIRNFPLGDVVPANPAAGKLVADGHARYTD